MKEAKQIELPSWDELMEWLSQTYGHLNPEVKPFFIMGIEALYVKLGGNKFVSYK